ncbi:activity-regulated cytoskeleton associated protein 1-like [Drosophila grimshawi]|uniref:activity-regulated cytoskeleton associated protein 1-like n=1 Tax=Drosophila grimshawi TaxID=7222 RepID=UPI000C86F6A3|nr:activity-regulated cytoskeleton associated protein 1-like [Drosophila grimshawi]XP_032590146.1 activity-regulated cytoskeleton associated protein 1-like [Drosophila grimshawi]
MATIQMTNEQLRELIEAVRVSAVSAAGNAAAAAANGEGSTSKTKGSFSNCSHRFGGARKHDEVEEFITNIVTYKELEDISDENALKGISLLFYGMASTWWQGVRKEAKTWEDAIGLIREHFSPTKPAYQVYMEFFEKKQEDSYAIDTFVVEKRALLAQLPEDRHDEETELDFLYGLLNIKYRKHISRQSVQTFKDLLEQGRIIEHNNQEDEEHAKGPLRGARRVERCTYCNFRGHTFDVCRKRQQARQDANNEAE